MKNITTAPKLVLNPPVVMKNTLTAARPALTTAMPNAVNNAKQYVQPTAEKSAMVSSHNQVFKKRNKELVKQMFQS